MNIRALYCLFILALGILSFGYTHLYAKSMRLFDTIEFKAKKDRIPAWVDVIERQLDSLFFEEEYKKGNSYYRFVKKYKTLEHNPIKQLQLVNNFWNKYPCRQDIHNIYKKKDYWAIPEEMAKFSGDCEDYAIAKFYTLKKFCFPAEAMRIVVVREKIRKIPHAVLAVYYMGDIFILDNLSNKIYSHNVLTNYDPAFSVNESWSWVHMKVKERKK